MKKFVLQLCSLIVIVAMLGACATPTTEAPKPTAVPPTAAPKPTEAPKPTAAPAMSEMDKLVEAAKKEGELNVIALPRDWANYGEMIDTFKKKYGLKVNEINPDAGSADELQAIVANKDNKGPQAPDVIDVGFAFGPEAKDKKLVQAYKVSTWASIPENLKDAEGFWYGDYYGVMSFQVNKDLVKNIPQDWSDLLKPEYKGQVALAGDPRKSSQAISAVHAATLGNNGKLDDAISGLDFFAKLNKAGNFVPVIGKAGTLAKGETPIVLRWDYLALGDRDTLKGNPPVEVVIPKSGVFGGVYVQGISAYAPHPNAAKLWMEFLYSDEGQLIWLKGYTHPIRYTDLATRKVIPADLAAKLPPAELYAKAVFPNLKQLSDAKAIITDNDKGWNKIVGADVK